MDIDGEAVLRKELSRFAEPGDAISLVAFTADVALYAAGVAVAVLAADWWLKILGVVVAGTATSTLFILGHDAAHKSLFRSATLNAVLGRIAFFPCLHNRTLWLIQHNRIHHQSTNVKGVNSFSPLSPDEYARMPAWRRRVERFYRSVAGFGAYYLIERWWKDKFFPRMDTPPTKRAPAWRDFGLILLGLVLLCGTLAWLGSVTGRSPPIAAMIWGFVLPFATWNALMGTTAFLQHTNPHLPWFRTMADARGAKTQGELAVYVRCPRWYDVLSHNIMQHPPHHVNPRIPWFRLPAAQRKLDELLGADAVVAQFGPGYLLGLTRTCRLYDYDRKQWLDYRGAPTSAPERMYRSQQPAKAD
ncbi:MAG: fatty acid desaturase [Betaproteobacteria bacterium]